MPSPHFFMIISHPVKNASEKENSSSGIVSRETITPLCSAPPIVSRETIAVLLAQYIFIMNQAKNKKKMLVNASILW